MSKKHYCDQSHLSIDERKIIQTGIENRSTKAAIAETIGKDPTTVAKEIRKHRELRPRNTFNYPVSCAHQNECRKGCKIKCPRFEEPKCNERDRSPGACNKCPKMSRCHLDKYFYNATRAYDEYRYDLVDSREGINLTTLERRRIADIIVPLIKQEQSIYQILSAHPEIGVCEKTIYNYIEQGVFNDFGIGNLSLKEKVQRKQFKKKYKKRKEPANYENRKYKDYLEYIKANPDIPTVEMDTVYNEREGPYIQTFIFEKSLFMIGFIHEEKTSDSMAKSLDELEGKLESPTFMKLFPLILTDRGTEFEKHQFFEFNRKTGESRLNIFYCDPMQSSQKPHVENNHNYVRDIIPNEVSLDNVTNADLELVFSHVNNTPRESLNGKTPYEMFEFMHSKEIIDLFNIKKLQRDEVILKPYLLKLKKK